MFGRMKDPETLGEALEQFRAAPLRGLLPGYVEVSEQQWKDATNEERVNWISLQLHGMHESDHSGRQLRTVVAWRHFRPIKVVELVDGAWYLVQLADGQQLVGQARVPSTGSSEEYLAGGVNVAPQSGNPDSYWLAAGQQGAEWSVVRELLGGR